MAIDFSADPPAPELFNEEAERVAKTLAETRQGGVNKSTQIRRFYDELVGWQQRIAGDEDKFKRFEAFIRMLNAKVAYAKGRKLVDDIADQCTMLARTEEDFGAIRKPKRNTSRQLATTPGLIRFSLCAFLTRSRG